MQNGSAVDNGWESETLRRLSIFINSLGDAFLAINSIGVIELGNSTAHSLFDANVLKGKHVTQVVHLTDNNIDADILSMIRNNPDGFSSREYRLKLASGESVDVYINASPLQSVFGKDNSGGMALLIRDIRREKKLESERDEFIKVASQEMRGPIAIAASSINNAIFFAQEKRLPEPLAVNLKTAFTQISYLNDLVNDFVMLSQADRGNLAGALEDVNLAQLMLQLENDYQPQASKKGLILRAQCAPNLPVIRSSKLYIYGILQNLVSNAIKYTDNGMVSVSAAAGGNGIDIEVADSGIGIDSADQAKLFDKFFRSENYRVRQVSGTGLGLYVAAKLAGVLGGTITVQSEIGKGSKFRLRLPAAPAPSTGTSNQKTLA